MAMNVNYERVVQWAAGPVSVLIGYGATRLGYTVSHAESLQVATFVSGAGVTWLAHNKWMTNVVKWWEHIEKAQPRIQITSPVATSPVATSSASKPSIVITSTEPTPDLNWSKDAPVPGPHDIVAPEPTGTVTRFGLDYLGFVSPADHHAVGSTFCCRYLRELGANEVNTMIGGGVDVVLNFEYQADRALGGYDQGVTDGKIALGQVNALGAPSDIPVYFSVDFDEAPDQASTVAEYFKGIASVLTLERTGCYGGYWTVSRLFNAGLIKWGWQTTAWSGGNFDTRCQLYQYDYNKYVGGVQVDFDHAYGTNFGQWSAGHPNPPHHNATGTAVCEVELNMDGHWSVKSAPGSFQPADHAVDIWHGELTFDRHTGHWSVGPLPATKP